MAALSTAAKRSGLPVPELRALSYDANADFAKPHGVDERDAVLLRPDGFVAWSSRSRPVDAALDSVLAAVMERVACRT